MTPLDIITSYSGRLYNSSSARAVARTWFLLRAEGLLYNKELVARFKKKLLKQARGEWAISLEELRRDPAAYLSVKLPPSHSTEP
ncbi:MAG: hypothetical protein ACK4M3_02735 [Pyrobaculum sp.]